MKNNQGFFKNLKTSAAVFPEEPEWKAVVTLSPGETAAQLQDVIENAGNQIPTQIELSADLILSGTEIMIPENKIIKLTSAGEQNAYQINANQRSRVLSVAAGAQVYLANIVLTQGTGAADGGGLSVDGGMAVAGTGAVISDNKTAGSGAGVNVADGGTFVLNGGEIVGNDAETDGGGIYVNTAQGSVSPLVISENSRITENTAGRNGGGIWIDHGYLYRLDVDQNVLFSQNKAEKAYNRNPADDATYGAHIHGTAWTDPFSQGYNNYDIGYTAGTVYVFPANVSLQAQKKAVGASLTAGEFSFGVFDAQGNQVAEGSNDASGGVSFSVLKITAPGVYQYTVKELTAGKGGWTTDDKVFPVAVTVTMSGDNQLSAEVSYPEGQPVFTNTYEQPQPTGVSVNLQAKKCICGAGMEANQFTFGLFDQNGKQIFTAVNAADGDVTFPATTYMTPGEYRYTIRELNISGGGWQTDDTIYPVTVTVVQCQSGQLTASVAYPEGLPVFINVYFQPQPGPGPAEAGISAVKRTIGARMCSGQFTFGIFDQSGNEVASAVNDNCGNIIFPKLKFEKPGEYCYQVRELGVNDGSSWTMDDRVYPVVVTVTDCGTGQLVARVSYPEKRPVFVNRFCSCCRN